MQIYGMEQLADQNSNEWTRYLLNIIEDRYEKALTVSQNVPYINIKLLAAEIRGLIHDMSFSIPTSDSFRLGQNEVPILPLLESLSVDKFLMLFNAILSEKKVIFVSDSTDMLVQATHASIRMIFPFSWNHLFIPVMYPKLVHIANESSSAIIGIRRSHFMKLQQQNLGPFVLVDLDAYDVMLCGNVQLIDLVGESGSTLKQASESIDKVMSKASELFFKTTGGSDSSFRDPNLNNRDIMANLITDLKSIVSSRPGTNSLQAVAVGLLRTIPGVGKSSEEASFIWRIQSEKILVESLLTFMVYILGSLDEFLMDTKMKHTESRQFFNMKAFILRKHEQGDSKSLIQFCSSIINSNMFELFCKSRLDQNYFVQQYTSNEMLQDIFSSVCDQLRQRQLAPTTVNIKQVISTMSTISDEALGTLFREDIHILTWKFTSGAFGFDFTSENFEKAVSRIVFDCYNSTTMISVMKTIQLRFDAAIYLSIRNINVHNFCSIAFELLLVLLLKGPASIISSVSDLLPSIRSLRSKSSSNSSRSVIDFISQSQTFSSPGYTQSISKTLEIFLDCNLLSLERDYLRRKTNKLLPISQFLAETLTFDDVGKKKIWMVKVDDYAIRFPRFMKLNQVFTPSSVPRPDYSKVRIGEAKKFHQNDYTDDDNESKIEVSFVDSTQCIDLLIVDDKPSVQKKSQSILLEPWLEVDLNKQDEYLPQPKANIAPPFHFQVREVSSPINIPSSALPNSNLNNTVPVVKFPPKDPFADLVNINQRKAT